MNDSTTPGDSDGTGEPALTQRNSQTVKGEETLLNDDDSQTAAAPGESSTRTKLGAIPSSYGAAGGMTPETDEGGDGASAE